MLPWMLLEYCYHQLINLESVQSMTSCTALDDGNSIFLFSEY